MSSVYPQASTPTCSVGEEHIMNLSSLPFLPLLSPFSKDKGLEQNEIYPGCTKTCKKKREINLNVIHILFHQRISKHFPDSHSSLQLPNEVQWRCPQRCWRAHQTPRTRGGPGFVFEELFVTPDAQAGVRELQLSTLLEGPTP